MQFPTEPTFAERLAVLANTFRYRCGPMILLAALFLATESPRLQVFGVMLLCGVAFEGLLKFFLDARKD